MPAARAPGTPDSVTVTSAARAPVTDPTLGIPVPVRVPIEDAAPPRHRLVTVGDSLTHGFMSLAVERTDASYPALIARALGWPEFRHASYEGLGGIPLNLEWLLRGLEREFGDRVDVLEAVFAFLAARRLLNRHEDYWERGPGARITRAPGIMHNLAVYGWDLRDALSIDADLYHRRFHDPHDARLFAVMPENTDVVAGLRVLESARDARGNALTPLEAAAAHGEDGGIETLIVWLGANNVLPTILSLTITWSEDDFRDLVAKRRYSIWRPEHFAAELEEVAAAVRRVRARHVLWGTVPHVTIAPLARGVGGKLTPASRFFRYYARPWVHEEAFLNAPDRYPHFTGDQARAIDSAIDQYNDTIVAEVRRAREMGLDWRVVDIAGVLDRLARRRYLDTPAAKPDWWTPYDVPQPLLDALGFEPDTLFLRSGPDGITQGGFVSLDGVHPTVAGYAIVAHEFIRAMRDAGVAFAAPGVDWAWAVAQDTLLSDPLRSLGNAIDTLGWLDGRFAIIARAERAMRFKNPE